MIEKLETWPPQKQLLRIILVAAVSFLIISALMRIVSEPIEAESSYDVIDLEFAWTSDRMDTILEDWGDDLIEREIWATYLDFGFLVAYGTLLAGFSLLIGRKFKDELLASLAFRFVVISYIASIFDALENLILLFILYSPDSYPNFAPFLATVCAIIKFVLIIITILYILAATLVYVMKKVRKTS